MNIRESVHTECIDQKVVLSFVDISEETLIKAMKLWNIDMSHK